MNRQINYIISAFLLLFLLVVFIQLAGLFVVDQKHESTGDSRNSENIPTQELSDETRKGQIIFKMRCASCHILGQDATGPSLIGFEERGPWTDRKNVYEWINDPVRFMQKNEYVRDLKKRFGGAIMTAFPEMTAEEIDAICSYIKQRQTQQTMPVAYRR